MFHYRTILRYKKYLSTLGSPDGTVVLSVPLRFEINQRQSLRLIKASFSSNIPNIYSYGGVNNGLLRLSRDGGATWTSIQLPNGIYTMPYIEAAVNAAVMLWWSDGSDPGIKIRYNLATEYTYISLDSTKLVAPGTQLAIDLSQSLICNLLGYSAVKTFDVDGTHAADVPAQMDWFGNNVSICLSGFGQIGIGDGMPTELCSIPLSTAHAANEYVYPVGILSPEIILPRPQQELLSFSVSFYGSRLEASGMQRSLLITEGEVEVILELAWN